FESLLFYSGSGSFDGRPTAILGQRFARKENFIGCFAGASSIAASSIIEIAPRAAIFVTAAVRIAAATTTVVAAIFVAAIIATVTTIAALLPAIAALRRSVLGGRQVAPTALAEIASSTPAATSTSTESASAAAKLRTVATATAITSTIAAALAAAVTT